MFDQRLQAEWTDARRNGTPLSLHALYAAKRGGGGIGSRRLRELLLQGHAIDLGGDGYPLRYTAQAKHVLPKITEDESPHANPRWLLDAWLLIEAMV